VAFDDKDKFMVPQKDVAVMEEILQLLEPLKVATDQWQAEKTVSISLVYPVVFAILRKLGVIQMKTPEGIELQRHLLQEMEFRLPLQMRVFSER